ncbi:hypothetical protein Tco_0530751 [Tanacetum coccineum]
MLRWFATVNRHWPLLTGGFGDGTGGCSGGGYPLRLGHVAVAGQCQPVTCHSDTSEFAGTRFRFARSETAGDSGGNGILTAGNDGVRGLGLTKQ